MATAVSSPFSTWSCPLVVMVAFQGSNFGIDSISLTLVIVLCLGPQEGTVPIRVFSLFGIFRLTIS